MKSKKNLEKAFAVKNDEFYTQLPDIEKELRHYRKHFKGKTVLCNCDDPRISNFFQYFSLKFEKLGLKKLITTCYKSQKIDSFSKYDSDKGLKLYYEGDKNNNRIPDNNEIERYQLESDGDFRSQECIDILKTVDIVVTNPPFSLFREYVSQLIEYKKKFLIIGNLNAVSYVEIFKLLKNNKIWLGENTGNVTFKTPSNEKLKHIVRVFWFTNLDNNVKHEDLILYKKYNKDDYPKYDNYDAINVNKTKNIPKDFSGLIGVPITFFTKYNPKQFEIIDSIGRYSLLDGATKKTKGKYLTEINEKRQYARVIIKHKRNTK